MGSVEYGDVYSKVQGDDGRPIHQGEKFVRGQVIGRLIIDFGNDEFWMRPIRGAASRLTFNDLSSLIANDLIEFDQPGYRKQLLQYLVEYNKRRTTLHENEMRRVAQHEKAQAMQADTKLQRSVRMNTRIARLTWTFAMIGMVAMVLLLSLPKEVPAPASATISGIGQELPVASDSLQSATYVQALGSGTKLYGVVIDAKTKEVGDTNGGNATITENEMYNPEASSQPMHLRPLYYDKASFYQTQLQVDTYGNSKTAIYLQNPNGYALGVSANQIMLTSGSGLNTIPVLTPDAYTDKSASDTQSSIEDSQADTAEQLTSMPTSSGEDTNAIDGSDMPDGWLGVDHASVNNERLAASYWYTKGNTGKTSDKHRRIAILNIKDVLANGISATSNMDIAQINYQDVDSNYYAPEISMDTDSNGTTYLLGYMKQDYDGNTGFFLRRIESNEDVLVESYTNTFSTQDLTGSSDPIGNYHFVGNRLFFEQSGYIWMMNVSDSKLTVSINGNQRTVSRENAIRICKSSDIYSSVTGDESRAANEAGVPVAPVAHYTPMDMRAGDSDEYGLVFVEAGTGDLIFQPAVDMTTASSAQGNGSGGASTANGVTSGDDAAVQNLIENDTSSSDKYDRNMEGTMVDIPDVMGMTATEAIKTLEDLKFTVVTTGGTGVVVSCSPSGQAAYASTITLTLGNGQSPNGGTTGQSSANSAGRQEQLAGDAKASGTRQVVSLDQLGNVATNVVTKGVAGEDTNANALATDDSVNTQADENATNATDTDSGSDDANDNANDGDDSTNENGNGKASNAIDVDTTSAIANDEGNGRIAIRYAQKDHVAIVCFTIRGQQVVWIEADEGGATRHVKFSPIYYKDSRSTVEAYEEDENVQSAISNDTTSTDTGNPTVAGADTMTGADAVADAAVSPDATVTDGTQDATTGTDPNAIAAPQDTTAVQGPATQQQQDPATTIPEPVDLGTGGNA